MNASTIKANVNKTRLHSGGSELSGDDVSFKIFHSHHECSHFTINILQLLQCKSSSESGNKWHTVGIFKDLSQIITGYIDHDDWNSTACTVTSENIPDLSHLKRVALEPGTPYRFRLAALNGCGRGDFGEVNIFVTKKKSSTNVSAMHSIFLFVFLLLLQIRSVHRSKHVCLVFPVHRQQ